MVGVAAGIPSFLALVLAVVLAVVCVRQWKNYSWNQVTTFHPLGALLLPSLGLHIRNLIQHIPRHSDCLCSVSQRLDLSLGVASSYRNTEGVPPNDLLTSRELKKKICHHCSSGDFSVISYRK